MYKLNKGSSQNKGGVGGKKKTLLRMNRSPKRTDWERKVKGKRGAHVHDDHVILWMEPLWSGVQWTLPEEKDTL